MVSISVIAADVTVVPCDLLILKYADSFHGADAVVASAIGFRDPIPNGRHKILAGKNIEAEYVMYSGVGPLYDFDYDDIRLFVARSLEIAQEEVPKAKRIALTIHGVGYGLDEYEAFRALLKGIRESLDGHRHPQGLQGIFIVEGNVQRAMRLGSFLDEEGASRDSAIHTRQETRAPPRKLRLFVAMPFKEELEDEWEIAIQEATHANDMMCERIDKTEFLGDIVSEIRRRIEEYDGLIAMLNGANPNVFLEIGYAWARAKPIVFIAKDGQDLPFDIKGQRCLFYKNINDLRAKLRTALGALKETLNTA